MESLRKHIGLTQSGPTGAQPSTRALALAVLACRRRLIFDGTARALRDSRQNMGRDFQHVQKLSRPFRRQLSPFAVASAFFEISGKL
jgi:hypothetical protein